MLETLILPDPLRAQLAAVAEVAFPVECCGLIEGRTEALAGREALHVTALHPTRNLSAEPDRFEIDPAAHVRLLRALRGTGRDIVGCYHSHPNGRAEPSETDRARAADEDFVWLIQPVTSDGPGPAAGFVFAGGAFRPIALSA